jgi:hypothetical protein
MRATGLNGASTAEASGAADIRPSGMIASLMAASIFRIMMAPLVSFTGFCRGTISI